MSGTLAGHGLKANLQDRLQTSYQHVSNPGDALVDAGHQTARLASLGYDRLADFTDNAADVIHLGNPGLEKTSRSLVADSHQTPVSNTSVPQAVPRAFSLLMGHMATMRRAAVDGIKQGIMESNRLANSIVAGAQGSGQKNRQALETSVTIQALSVAAFARAANTIRVPSIPANTRLVVAEQASKLRLFSCSMTLGAVMGTRMVADVVLDKASRAARYMNDASVAIHVGGTETLRNAASNRYMRTIGYVAAAAGLVAIGASHGGDLVRSLDSMHSHLGNPMAFAGNAARGINAGMNAQVQTDSLSNQALVDMMHRATLAASNATRAASDYVTSVAQILGKTTYGQEIIKIAGQTHSLGLMESFGQASSHLFSHVANSSHPAHAVLPLHEHLNSTHMASRHIRHVAHATSVSEYGDHTSDSLNGAELAKIKLDALRASHAAVSTGQQAVHHAATAHRLIHSPLFFSAPTSIPNQTTDVVTPVYSRPLSALPTQIQGSVAQHQNVFENAVKITNSSLSSVTSVISMPYVDTTTITRELNIAQASQPSIYSSR